MTEAEWLAYPDPKQILEWLRDGVTCRKLRLFATGSVRQFWDLLIDERSREAVRVAEEVADGRESEGALDVAYRRAWDAVPQLPSDRFAHVSAARAAGRAVQNDYDAWYASDLTVNETFGVYWDLHEEAGSSDDEQSYLRWDGGAEIKRLLSGLLCDIFGNPFRPVAFFPEWSTSTAVALAAQMYESRDFGAMPILADALQDAGCDSADVLAHCRGPGAARARVLGRGPRAR